jgi:cyclopropane fatty-acyl-phospholipid synthase-like methyltransferase
MLFHHDFTVFDRYRWVRSHTRTLGRVLDAGCGSGAFTMFAATRAREAVGLTLSFADAEKARRRAEIVGAKAARFEVCDLRRLKESSAQLGLFEEIWCLEVIEHIIDDVDLVRRLADLLAPGGRLLLTTPNVEYTRMYGDTISAIEDGGHVRWGYSPKRLEDIATLAGLRVQEAGFVSGRLTQVFTNWYRRLSAALGQPIAWALVLPLRPLVIFDSVATRLTSYPYLSVAMVAAKSSSFIAGETYARDPRQ